MHAQDILCTLNCLSANIVSTSALEICLFCHAPFRRSSSVTVSSFSAAPTDHYQANLPRCQDAVQDGPAAGQTVPHVHVHCLPRYFEDIHNNDEIYDMIDDAEKAEASSRLRRCAATRLAKKLVLIAICRISVVDSVKAVP
jgi:hypothetical protein